MCSDDRPNSAPLVLIGPEPTAPQAVEPAPVVTRDDVLEEMKRQLGIGVPNSYAVTNHGDQLRTLMLAELIAHYRNLQRQGDTRVQPQQG